MKPAKIFIISLLTICVFAALPACKSKRAAPDMGGKKILRFHDSGDPNSLDPNIGNGSTASVIMYGLFEGLTRMDPKTHAPLPGTAERWEISEDGKTYTFYIREDARWSDGIPVTAHDFVYSWERILNPITSSSYSFILYAIDGAQDYNTGKTKDSNTLGFKAVSDKVLVVRLKHPIPYFASLTSFYSYYPIPKHVVEKFHEKWISPGTMVNNGPFKLDQYVSQKEIVTSKNTNYWGADGVKLDGVTFLIVDDANTALKKFMAGEMDTLHMIPPQLVGKFIDHPCTLKSPAMITNFYAINVTRPPFNDARVRRAFSLALDRKKIAEMLPGTAFAWGNIVPKGFENYPYPKTEDFNPAKARELLAEAGYKDPSTFPKITLLYNTVETQKIVAEVIQQMWKKNLGVDVGLINEEFKVFLNTKKSGNFQIARAGWAGDYLDPNTFLDMFISNSTHNNPRWKNLVFDSLIDNAANSKDHVERMRLLAKAEALMLKEAPIIQLYQYVNVDMAQRYVKGYYPNLLNIHPVRDIDLDEDRTLCGF